MKRVRMILAATLTIFCSGVSAQAPPQVSFEGVAAPGNQAGGSAVIDLTFTADLPAGYHVNSNAPLEEFLRPTRLILEVPDGAAVGEIRYPDPVLFKARFAEQPLSVYEHRFELGATLDVGDLPPGEYAVEATLKYQACSERICYPPTTRSTQVSVVVWSEAVSSDAVLSDN